MSLESKLLDAYRSARIGKIQRLQPLSLIRETLPIFLCVFMAGCTKTESAKSGPFVATISGNSMEPTLLGPQRIAQCQSCNTSMRFSSGSAIENRPTPCPRCGNDITWQGTRSGQTVKVQPVDWSQSSLRRGDMVVIRDSDSNKLEIKRVVGLPHESVEIIDGDLWIDGYRFQKSIAQFASQAIEVDQWSEIERQHSAVSGDVPRNFCFESFSLWPRVGERLVAFPSPILDEYRCNALESRELVAVRDIGLKFMIAPSESIEAKLEIQIWSDGAIHRLTLLFSPNGFRMQHPGKTTSSDKSIDDYSWPFTNSHSSQTVIIATVDGQLLVGTSQSGTSHAPNEFLLHASNTESDCSPTKPMGMTVLEGQITILQAIIVRDIHYRGWHGESEFLLPPVDGYHLLGDNVSSSLDSRQRWPEGVSAKSIVGRVETTD